MTDFWNKYELDAEVQKSNGDLIRSAYALKSGRESVDLRVYYHDRITDELLPGKGVNIPIELAEELGESLIRIVRRAKNRMISEAK